MARMLIKGGTLVLPDGTLEADLIIEGEKIAGIVNDAHPEPDDQVIDATGLFVMPGIVDAHTHIALDTGLYKTADNWKIGSKAAAAGGVTTVIDFANPVEGKPLADGLAARQVEAAGSIIDYTFHMVILGSGYDPETLGDELQVILGLGITSVKLFTTYRPNYYMPDAGFAEVFKNLPDGMLVMVHAENDGMVSEATQNLIDAGQTAWKYHPEGRPAKAESDAIEHVIKLAQDSNKAIQLYFAHCTTQASIMNVKYARLSDQSVHCETCPQYLLLDRSRYDGDHPEHFILQPPLRDYAQTQALIKNILEREISVISTDSCDYSLEQKQASPNFTETPGGLPGLETMLPLMVTLFCDTMSTPIERVVKLMTTNPAKIFGLYPRKGILQVGSDADVVLYDPKPEWTIHHEDLHYVAAYSPYEGMRVRGRVLTTISRGEIIYQFSEDDPFAKANPGRGKFIPGSPVEFNARL